MRTSHAKLRSISGAHRARRAGLTLAELIAGLATTGMVAAGVAAFSTAAATGWNASRQSAALGATGSRASTQFDSIARSCLAVVQTKSPGVADASSYAFLWAADTFDGVADGKAQAGEMLLIEFDPRNATVWLYAPRAEADMTNAEHLSADQSNWGNLASPEAVDYFRSANFLQPRRALIGPGLDATSRAARVIAANFTSITPDGGKPTLMFAFALTPSEADAPVGAPTTIRGAVTLRSPQTPSNAGG